MTDPGTKHAAGDEPPRTAELARCVQRGDLSQLEALYVRTAPALYAWAAVRAPADVDPGDVLAEVWVRAIERLSTHDSENHEIRAWLFGIAKNVLLQTLRSRGGRGRTRGSGFGPLGGSTNGLDRVPDSVTSISRKVATEECIRRFLDYATDLDVTDRELLVHCGLEGTACVEVARRLAIGGDAATKRWQRLRAELRQKPWVRGLLLQVE
jgi:RNA polymerase sigma-70 factor (ECF subfamily)